MQPCQGELYHPFINTCCQGIHAIPLEQAAKIAYEKTQNTLAAHVAEHDFCNKPADPVGYYAHLILGSNENESIQLYGCKPMLNILNPISYRERRSNYVVIDKEAARLEKKHNKAVVYERLHVKKSDLKKRIKIISFWSTTTQDGEESHQQTKKDN